MIEDNAQTADAPSPRDWLGFTFILTIFLILIGGGYAAFRSFVTASNLGGVNLSLVAIGAGIASFFSPCAFPLLPGYFSFYQSMDMEQAEEGRRFERAIRLGLAASLGVISFNLVLGMVVSLLSASVAQGFSITDASPNTAVLLLRIGIGLLLLLLGVGQLAGWTFKPRILEPLLHRVRPRREPSLGNATTLYLYGLGYTAAGLGCTGPILAGLIVLALGAGGFGVAALSFLIFSFTMGLLMFSVSLIVSRSRYVLIRRMKSLSPKIKTASALLLILVASFQIYTVLDLQGFIRTLFP